jgi:hypothetical protein
MYRVYDRTMSTESYPAAGLIAPAMHAHFARHLAAARGRGMDRLAELPGEAAIARMVNAAFWASLRREEGYIPKISLAFLSPDQSTHPLLLERPLSLDARSLAKIAPVVERAGIHLGVWPHEDELKVWGITRSIPSYCFVLEVVEPGLLVIKHHGGEAVGKFVNVAALEGDRIKIVDERASSLPDCPALLQALMGFDSPASWFGTFNVRVQLAVSMRAHGRGGSMLIVPSNTDRWRESIVQPMPYAVVPALRELADLMHDAERERLSHVSQEASRLAVDAMAGLTAIDGATILTDISELLAFGVKIARRRGSPQVEHVRMTEPIVGGAAVTLDASHLGGTRHLSAAQFAYDQRDSVALVASQDRRFTIFAWSPCEEMVHAHRVETLLL